MRDSSMQRAIIDVSIVLLDGFIVGVLHSWRKSTPRGGTAADRFQGRVSVLAAVLGDVSPIHGPTLMGAPSVALCDSNFTYLCSRPRKAILGWSRSRYRMNAAA